jgi:hypothetical protein
MSGIRGLKANTINDLIKRNARKVAENLHWIILAVAAVSVLFSVITFFADR